MDVFIDPRFDAEFERQPLVLVDVGARGGLKANWAAARRHLRLVGFEPESLEFQRLIEAARTEGRHDVFVDVALHNTSGPITLHVARDRGLSSVFRPNRAFLDSFPDAERFDTVDVREIQADALDAVLAAHAIDAIDFIKADTQGSELFVLQGASRSLEASVLGVEVEVEFTAIYEGQPLFPDVDAFMRGLGFMLFDLRPVYWKRNLGQDLGGPWGQIVWADALYLKGLPALRATVQRSAPEARKAKALKAVSVALLYGYADYALDIVRETTAVLTADERSIIEKRVRASGRRRVTLPQFPGKRLVRGALHRFWNLCRERDEGWAISGAKLGNPD